MPFLKEVSPRGIEQFNYYRNLTKEELIREAPTWKHVERLSTKIYDTKNTVVVPKDTLVLTFKYWSVMSFCITERDLYMPNPLRFNTLGFPKVVKPKMWAQDHVYYYISSLDAPRGRNAYVYVAGDLATKLDNLI